MADQKLYADRRPWDLEPHYSAHVMAMTAEDLHSKADIAAELAFRDKEIERLCAEAKILKHHHDQWMDAANGLLKTNDALRAEVEQLKSIRDSVVAVLHSDLVKAGLNEGVPMNGVLIHDYLPGMEPKPVVAVPEGWLEDSGLLYRLKGGVNYYEVNVTMVAGSRDIAARSAFARSLLAADPQPEAPKP